MIEDALIRAYATYIQKGRIKPPKKKGIKWDENLHPREGKGSPTGGRFKGGVGREKKPQIPWEIWKSFNQATLSLQFWLGIPQISKSDISFPKQVKRTKIKGEWRGTYTMGFQLREDVDGVGTAGSWVWFKAGIRATKNGFKWPEEEWEGPPELRP